MLKSILIHTGGLQPARGAERTSSHFGLFSTADTQPLHDGARGHLQRQRLPKTTLASLPPIRRHGFQLRGKLKANVQTPQRIMY